MTTSTKTERRCPACGGLLMLSRDYCLGCLADVKENPPAVVPWWVDFVDGTGACVEAATEDRVKAHRPAIRLSVVLLQREAVRRTHGLPAKPILLVMSDARWMLRLVAGKRAAEIAWTEERPVNPLLWVWTVREAAHATGERAETIRRACSLLGIVPRPVDRRRPDLSLLSCVDVSRIVAALLAEPRPGVRRRRRERLVSKAMADAQLAAWTGLLDGLYRGPSSLEAEAIGLVAPALTSPTDSHIINKPTKED